MDGRIILFILDGLGIGASKDAQKYESIGAHTFEHAALSNSHFQLNALQELGLGNVYGIQSVPKTNKPLASFGRAQEITAGNDTYAGIWEIAGIIRKKRAQSFKPAMDKSLLQDLWKNLGTKTLCNQYKPWREVGAAFYDEQLRTRLPIIYTSNDGVIISAAHTDTISPTSLYQLATKMAGFFRDKDVIRIIAHPYCGTKNNIIRTKDRKDFYIHHHEKNHLYQFLKSANIPIVTTRILYEMIGEHFAQSIGGILKMKETFTLATRFLKQVKGPALGIFLIMEVDLAGHRRDLRSTSDAIMQFDEFLPDIIHGLNKDDLLIITADHGQDGYLNVRAHTREYVPLLVFNPRKPSGKNLGTCQTYADTGQTIAEIFNLPSLKIGRSYAKLIE